MHTHIHFQCISFNSAPKLQIPGSLHEIKQNFVCIRKGHVSQSEVISSDVPLLLAACMRAVYTSPLPKQTIYSADVTKYLQNTWLLQQLIRFCE